MSEEDDDVDCSPLKSSEVYDDDEVGDDDDDDDDSISGSFVMVEY